MSTKEMEAMDNEVMGVVNGHATPVSMANADEIAEREAVRQMNAEEPQGSVPAERENERDDKVVWQLRKKEFDELSANVETAKRRKTLTTVILCALLAAALLVVLAVPKLLIWLVNIGVVSCAVIAGIAIDRWRR